MRIILFSLLLLTVEQLSATGPVIGTTTFNNNFMATGAILGSTSPATALNVGTPPIPPATGPGILSSGWDFTITGITAGNAVSISATSQGANPGGASDFAVRGNCATGVLMVGLKSDDGSSFSLQTAFLKVNITAGAPANMIITGFRSGSPVAGATKTVNGIASATWAQFDVSTVPEFENVDEFRFSQAGTSSATITFAAVDQITIASNPLPLTLIDFSALHSNGNAILQWTTASEQNTSDFEIQRSENTAGFATIGRLPAAGQSEGTRQYSYTDVLPATEAPAYFYRLKMVDLDGAFTYSPVLKFNTTGSGPTLSAWPNPFHQQLTVTMEAEAAERSRLTIRDLSGKLLIGQDLPLQKGTNSIPLSSLSRLAKGVYLLTITTSRGQQTLSVLKSD